MAVINFPAYLAVEKTTWGQKRNDIEFRSVFGAQAVETTAPLWVASVSAPSDFESLGGDWQAFLMRTRGRTNQVALWNLARPAPLGTARGSMTLGVAANQGDVTLTISVAGQDGNTLLPGDLLGFGSGTTQQVVMVTALATVAAGSVVVSTEPAVRNGITISSNVIWDKPTVLFRRANTSSQWSYDTNMAGGFSLDLIEDTRP